MQQQQQATQQQLPQKVGANPSPHFPRPEREARIGRERRVMNSLSKPHSHPGRDVRVPPPSYRGRHRLRERVLLTAGISLALLVKLCAQCFRGLVSLAPHGLHEEASKVILLQMRELRLRKCALLKARVRTSSACFQPLLFALAQACGPFLRHHSVSLSQSRAPPP